MASTGAFLRKIDLFLHLESSKKFLSRRRFYLPQPLTFLENSCSHSQTIEFSLRICHKPCGVLPITRFWGENRDKSHTSHGGESFSCFHKERRLI